jgi:hypothetical protein
VAVSAGSPEPSWQLPLPPDSGPEQRRVKPVHLLVGSLLALTLLCCGGAAAVEVFTGGEADKTGAATGTPSGSATPSDPTTSAVKAAVATSPTPSATPKKTPKRKPSTPRPTTAPTTRPPTKTPSPTPTATTPTLPIVRAGAFCSPVGAFGITAKGKLMRCTRESEDERPRWRAVQSQGVDL